MDSSESPPTLAESSTSASRNRRAAIATQACGTCRARKTKCDEKQPKCSLCQKLDTVCIYQEPKPTKKDKTLLEIVDFLRRLEDKVDRLENKVDRAISARGQVVPAQFQQESIAEREPYDVGWREQPYDPPYNLPVLARRLENNRFTIAQRVLLWPAIERLFISAGGNFVDDLHQLQKEGTAWFIQQELKKHAIMLPCDVGLDPLSMLGSTVSSDRSRLIFPALTKDLMTRFADLYFNSFNVIYPIIDYESFMEEIMPIILQDGFEDDSSRSIIAILVFTLGKVALDGVSGQVIANADGSPSGFRGGDGVRPPALDIFNEARRRLGFVVSQCSLECAQVFLLMGLYFESAARHIDAWRSVTMASEALQLLLRGPVDWASHQGDILKRVYWSCIVLESWYYVDLGLPKTSISERKDLVPFPIFLNPETELGNSPMESAEYQYNFLSMIALRRLIERVQEAVHQASSSESDQNYSPPPAIIVEELSNQLNSWRANLPECLQWNEHSRCHYKCLDPSLTIHIQCEFGTQSVDTPVVLPYNADIVAAQLRSRFYYCQFLLYRPYIYKALHYPDEVTSFDIRCCKLCLQSFLSWPVCMSPPREKKRLIPNTYVWTQNFLGFLLILRSVNESPLLRTIYENEMERQQIDESIRLMMEWMKDMRQVDGTAEWSWGILEKLYGYS